MLSATIQMGLLPLLAENFHRVSIYGPASNVPAVLLTGLIVPLGFLTLATASFGERRRTCLRNCWAGW